MSSQKIDALTARNIARGVQRRNTLDGMDFAFEAIKAAANNGSETTTVHKLNMEQTAALRNLGYTVERSKNDDNTYAIGWARGLWSDLS